MIISETEYHLHPESSTYIECVISTRSFKLYCKKEDAVKLDMIVIAIQRLMNRLSNKYHKRGFEYISIMCIIDILSSKNIDELIEKTEEKPSGKIENPAVQETLFAKHRYLSKKECCQKTEDKMLSEFIKILQDISIALSK